MSKGWRVLAGAILATGVIMAGCAGGEVKKEALATATVKVIATINVPPTSDEVTLQWKFQNGKTCKYQMTQETQTNTVVSMMGNQQSMAGGSIQTLNYSEKVTAVDDKGLGTIEVKYDSVKLDMDIPMQGKISFDSTNKEDVEKLNDPDNQMLASFAGPIMVMTRKPFTTIKDKSGNILEARGFQELMKEMLEDKGNSLNPMLKAGLNEEWFSNMLKQSSNYHALPAQGVVVGASWTKDINFPMPMMGTMKGALRNTYVGDEVVNNRKCARINQVIDMFFQTDQMPFADKFDVAIKSENGTGVMYFDYVEGVLVKNEVITKLQMTMSPKKSGDNKEGEEEGDGGDMAGMMKNMNMTMDMEMRMTLELKE